MSNFLNETTVRESIVVGIHGLYVTITRHNNSIQIGHDRETMINPIFKIKFPWFLIWKKYIIWLKGTC